MAEAVDLHQALEHPLWYRVSDLQVRLRAHVQVQRRESHGDRWYVLIDSASGRFHRVNRAAYAFIGRIDGRRSVGALWQHVHAELGEKAPSQTDVMHLLARLADAELLSTDAAPDLQALLVNKDRRASAVRLAAVNPLAFRVPLFDPSRLLDWLLPFGLRIFTLWGGLAWCVWVASAGVLALSQARALQHDVAAMSLSPTLLLTLWLGYPVVKLVHEFGHGLALRVWGGQVREIGITLMALTPVPYVDASAATQLPQRHRRVLVGAAGVMVELAIAALALWVWVASSHPGLQQVALALVLMCGASSLLFNGNPLLRFDGYYVLSDALDMPNLGRRADATILRSLQRLLGLPFDRARAERRTDAPWLAVYSVASLLYRVLLGGAIVVWLHDSWPVLALAAALWLSWGLLFKPLQRLASYLLFSAQVNGHRARALGLVLPSALALLAGLLWLPLPSASVQQGVVWLPDQAVLRAPVEGSLQSLLAVSGQRVIEGTPVARLDNLGLQSELATARAKAVALDVQHFQALHKGEAKATRLAEEEQALKGQIGLLEQRLGQLELRAETAGTLVLPRTEERLGHHHTQGSEIAYVLPDAPPLVKVALSEAQAALLQTHAAGQGTAVAVRLASHPDQAFPAVIERRTPQTTRSLPSAALGQGAGGPIATDPSDRDGRTALQPVVLLDVRLTMPLDPQSEAPMALQRAAAASSHLQALGQRAWVRIQHPSEALLPQAWRALRQLFLRSLGASG